MSGILVVGDSISYGEHLPDRLTQAWPWLLGGMLGTDVVNLSVCGDTTRLALERAGEWQAMMRPTVIFQLGVNDANQWESDRGLPRVGAGAFYANLEEMVIRATHFGARIVVLATVARHERAVPSADDCRDYSDWVRESAAEQGCHVLDLEALGPLPTIDGLHLDPVGHARVAEAARELLERIEWGRA